MRTYFLKSQFALCNPNLKFVFTQSVLSIKILFDNGIKKKNCVSKLQKHLQITEYQY